MQQKQAGKRRKHERAINFVYGFLFYFSCILHFTERMDMNMLIRGNEPIASVYWVAVRKCYLMLIVMFCVGVGIVAI